MPSDSLRAPALLAEARETLSRDVKPKCIGEVKQEQHVKTTPLWRFWESWDGSPQPEKSFAALDIFLKIGY